jgi:predicted RNA methylase
VKTIQTERDLISLALAMIGPHAQLSTAETRAARGIAPSTDAGLLKAARAAVRKGADPLGDAFGVLRSPQVRRVDGATYTPAPIIRSMVTWSAAEGAPARVVDAGAGSGRFLLAAGPQFPDAQLVAIESDPVAALLLRANLAAAGHAARTRVLVADYRRATLPKLRGKTLFIGNPPYVRHHQISDADKRWFSDAAAAFGVKASKLAGLHIHFFVRTLQLAKPGDFGVFITSAEWLDVNYGATLRQLLAEGLGGVALHVLDPNAMPFTDATTTGAITCFRVGQRPDALCVRSVESIDTLNGLSKGTLVPWDTVRQSNRWSIIIRPGAAVPAGYVELGELCRVHRGQVTGGNSVWIAGDHTKGLPDEVLAPTVTKARDLIAAGDQLEDGGQLRRVVNLPSDLDTLPADAMPAVRRFLKWAKGQGAHESYIAQHRRAWWAVGLKDPAPLLCTYMARRAPAFVRNLCDARHINVAHGLYPRDAMEPALLDALAAWLRTNVDVQSGRTYAGGLTKFEPKEVERIWVPRPDELMA